METPFINIFDTGGDDDAAVLDLPLDSDKRAISFAASHFGFFMFNFINVAYLLVVEGYALRNLGKNFLHKLCLFGCAFQMCSCFTSMFRYNINDEFSSFWANGGTIFSNMGFAFCNSAVSVVWFYGSDNRQKWWTLTAIFWFLAHNINSVISYREWEEEHFVPFRPMVIIAAVYQTIAMIYCLVSLRKGAYPVNLAAASHEQFERVCQAMITVNVIALFLCTRAMPMFLYPETGWIYCTCVVFCKFAGQMDFAKPSGGERSALLG